MQQKHIRSLNWSETTESFGNVYKGIILKIHTGGKSAKDVKIIAQSSVKSLKDTEIKARLACSPWEKLTKQPIYAWFPGCI